MRRIHLNLYFNYTRLYLIANKHKTPGLRAKLRPKLTLQLQLKLTHPHFIFISFVANLLSAASVVLNSTATTGSELPATLQARNKIGFYLQGQLHVASVRLPNLAHSGGNKNGLWFVPQAISRR